MPRLRPEVIVPLRSTGGWARSLLLSCCAFIMFVTALDAMRYAARCHRETPRVHRVQRAAQPAPTPVVREQASPRRCQVVGPYQKICQPATSPDRR